MKGELIGITKKPDFGYQFFGSFFFLIAGIVFVYSVANGEIMGFVFCIAVTMVAIFWVQYEGVGIDFDQMFYQEYETYFGVRVGTWKPLPPITNVLVYAYQERIVQEKRTWTSMVQQQIIYKVSIFDTHTDFELMVCKTNEEEQAFEQAQELAHQFELELETDIRI